MPDHRLIRLSEPLEPVTPLVTATDLPNTPDDLALLPDGDTCVVATLFGLATVSLSSGAVTGVTGFAAGKDSLREAARLAVTPDGHVVGGHSDLLTVWDPDGWVVSSRLPCRIDLVTDLVVADGLLVTGGWSGGRGGATVWEAATGRLQCDITTEQPVLAVAVAGGGEHVVTVEESRRVMLWDARRGTPVRQLRPDELGGARAVDWLMSVYEWRDGTPPRDAYQAAAVVDSATDRLLVADGELFTGPIDEAGGLRRREIAGRAWRIAFRPVNGLLAAAVAGTVQLWDHAGDLVAMLGPSPAPVTTLIFTPDGRLVTGHLNGEVRVWPADPDQRPGCRHAHPVAVWRTVVHREGRYGRSLDFDGGNLLWDLRTGEDLTGTQLDSTLGPDGWSLPEGGGSKTAEYGIESRLTSEDGTCAVGVDDSIGEDGVPTTHVVRCRDLPSGEERWTWWPEPLPDELGWWWPAWVVLPRHADVAIVCVTGLQAAAFGDPAELVVLDLATGEPRDRFVVMDANACDTQALPDGSVLLRHREYSPGPTLHLRLLDWRTGTAEPYAVLPGGDNALLDADGLVVTADGNEVRLLDPRSLEPVAAVAAPAPIVPFSLSVSPDGRVIMAGDEHGGVHILHAPAP